jgi:hypothetical protein
MDTMEQQPAGSRPEPPREGPPTAAPDRAIELGFPAGLPYTVYFPGDDGVSRGADLEHPAPVPRVGEIVEYIDERGECQRYIVREVVHTLQTSAVGRPLVSAERNAATSLARNRNEPAELPGDGGELRAGLPKVFLERVPESVERPAAEQEAL